MRAPLTDAQAEGVASHPNQWFLASREYYKIKGGGAEIEAVKAEPATDAAPAESDEQMDI